MIDKCKHCGSKELYLEPRVKGQDILSADMVALKCKSCGKWLKWCPKNERVNYLRIEKPDKWQKLKEILKRQIDTDSREFLETGFTVFKNYIAAENLILDIMQELEAEDDK